MTLSTPPATSVTTPAAQEPPDLPPSDGQAGASEQGGVKAGRFRLLLWFLLLSFASVSLVSVTSAFLLARFMTERMLMLDVKLTTEFVNHMFKFENADNEFAGGLRLPPRETLGRFFNHVGQMPDVIRANIYLLDGTVYWSTDKSIVGRRFTDNDELAESAKGVPMAELGAIGTDDKEEHFNLGPPGMQFIENYIPMYREGRLDQQVLGVAEIYRTPANLLDVIRTGEWMIFAVAALGALLIIGTLCWLVGYADRVIRRQNVAIAESERLATAGEMAAAVAHGLRNPLAAIRSSAELGIRFRTVERILPLLDDIVLQADRLEHWVRQYLTAIEPHKNDRCSDVRAVLGAVHGALSAEMERQGIVWQEGLAPALPATGIGPALLEQLLNGVVANAVQAMPEGGTINVTAKPASPTTVLVEVVDTGCGMTEEQLQRAFQPFVTSKQSGLGLGLALARRILARHGGSIAIASALGHGTTVSISLPIAR